MEFSSPDFWGLGGLHKADLKVSNVPRGRTEEQVGKGIEFGGQKVEVLSVCSR